MSATIQLNSARFVKRASSGASLSKYGYIGMMQQLADAIMSAPWTEASADEVTLTTNQITKTDGVLDANTGRWTTAPTYTAYMDGKYDAFAQAGDGVARNATMCGYMGCVAYRFEIPPSESANTLQAVKLSLQRDRYLRAGVRVGMQISSSETPSDDWSVIRGEATGCVRSASTAPGEGVVGVESFGLLGQTDVPNVVSAYAAAATATFDTSANFTGLTSATYLWVYVTLEDPAAHWTMYSETESRQYFIEGSAMLMAESCSFTFRTEPSWTYGEQDEYGICLTSPYVYNNTNLWQLGGGDYPSQGLTSSDASMSISKWHFVVASDICAPGAFYYTAEGGYIPFASGYSANNGAQPDDGIDGWRGITGAYTDFYSDKMLRCDFNGISGSFTHEPSAAFFVGSISGGGDSTSFGVFMSRKKLLVPFLLKKGFIARQVKFDWKNPGGTYLSGVSKLRHNVWLASGKNINSYDSPFLQKHELWTAETGAVGEYVLVGSWEETYDSTDGKNTFPEHTKTLNLPRPIKETFNTLLLTVYVDYSSFTLNPSPTTTADSSSPQHAGFFDQESRNLSNGLFIRGGTLPGGWSPAITLLGTQT